MVTHEARGFLIWASLLLVAGLFIFAPAAGADAIRAAWVGLNELLNNVGNYIASR